MTDVNISSEFSHETKYVFDNHIASTLIQWLRLRCEPDPLFNTGIISSIYYDTTDWCFLNEKINSDYTKMKVRIRWYKKIDGSRQGNRSYLEAKYKLGSKRKKVRVKTDISSKWLSKVNLCDTDLLKIPMELWSMGVKMPSSLHPVFQISYKRFRFIEPVTRSRLCVDFDIHSPRTNWHLLPRIQPQPLGKGVFELKGKIIELPDTLKQLTALGCRKEAFSKYSSCYMKLMNTIF